MHSAGWHNQKMVITSRQILATLPAIVCLVANLVAGDGSCSIKTPDEQINRYASQNDCFRAAVFENNRNESAGDNINQRVNDNLNLYARAAKVAAENGANVLVFPENGIGDSPAKRGEDLEEIPDPDFLTNDNNNPCAQPQLFEDNEVLKRLSCMARENSLYLVANYGTRQSCSAGEKVGRSECPRAGHFKLNTNVVMDPQGNFIKRYRKYNLFLESFKGVFDHSPSLEEVYFDTPYGRFGVFTCFDVAFKWPAIDLVEKYHIDTVLFPTLWHDEAPIFSGLLAQDSWSRSNQVNLLAANLLKPELGAVGSGIYSGDSSFFTSAESCSGKLLIANVARDPRSKKCTRNFNPVLVEIDGTILQTQQYHYNNYQLQSSDKVESPSKSEFSGTSCSGKVCCTVDFKIRGSIGEEALSRLIILVRDDNRLGPFKFYEQVCLLATLEKPFDRNRLNETVFAREALVEFERLSLEATFESKYVMPVAATSLTQPMKRADHQFECTREKDEAGMLKCNHVYQANQHGSGDRIYSFGLYGRVYGRDKMPPGWTVASD